MADSPKTHRLAVEACTQFPDSGSLTIAKYLHREHPQHFPSTERARNAVRWVRGNMGGANRAKTTDKSLFRPNGKAGAVLLPDFIQEAQSPIQIDGPCRVGIVSDIHIPFASKMAVELAVKHFRKAKIDELLINGDLCDFHKGSRFEHSPDAMEMTEEMDQTAKFLQWLRGQFPKIPIKLKPGNHDERWGKWLMAGGSVMLAKEEGLSLESMLARRLDVLHGKPNGEKTDSLKTYGIEYVAERRRVDVGKLPVYHGHELGIKSSVQPGRTVFLKTSHTCLIGHLHSTNTYVKPDMNHAETACFSSGCLCELSPRWLPVNNWNWGAVIVDVASDNEFDVHNFRITADGKVRAS